MKALALAVMLLLAVAATASAHASLVESDPAEGETVATPVTLTASFDEPLGTDRSRIVVRNAAGDEVARGGISLADDTVMLVELPDLPVGTYVARWTAVTPEDGGVTRGTITFTVADAPAPTGSPGGTPSASPGGSPTAVPTQRPGGIPVLTPLPGTTPLPSPSATATPQPTQTAVPTARSTVAPSVSPTPTPAPAGTSNDLLLALVLATVIVGGLAAFLLRR